MNMNFMSQERIWNPEDQKSDLIIIGAGSTGSFIALTLAKMGFSQIEVIDFDKVEAHNIPNQFFRVGDVGELKIVALAKIIKEFTDLEVSGNATMLTEENIDNELDISSNSIIINCVDNMKARQLTFDRLKGFPVKLVDTRMGGEGFSIHVIDCMNEEDCKEYQSSLDKPVKDTPCGEKGIIYTILAIASETANIIKKLDQAQPSPKILRREMKTYRFIAGGDE